jgi:hypothetical protein
MLKISSLEGNNKLMRAIQKKGKKKSRSFGVRVSLFTNVCDKNS